jgi:hypothetical protein
MDTHTQASTQDEQRGNGRPAGVTRSRLAFGARAAVLAGVVATTCAAVPAASASAAARPAGPAVTAIALGGASGGIATPLASTCCP